MTTDLDRCPVCGATIIWARTPTGDRIALDVKATLGGRYSIGVRVSDGQRIARRVESGGHCPHSETCRQQSLL